MSKLIAGHDGDIPHLVSPRLVDGAVSGASTGRRREANPGTGRM